MRVFPHREVTSPYDLTPARERGERMEESMSRGRGGRPPSRSPESRAADKAQLADAPVSLRRIGRLFAAHRARLAFVVVLIVASSLIALAQPFLIKRGWA